MAEKPLAAALQDLQDHPQDLQDHTQDLQDHQDLPDLPPRLPHPRNQPKQAKNS